MTHPRSLLVPLPPHRHHHRHYVSSSRLPPSTGTDEEIWNGCLEDLANCSKDTKKGKQHRKVLVNKLRKYDHAGRIMETYEGIPAPSPCSWCTSRDQDCRIFATRPDTSCAFCKRYARKGCTAPLGEEGEKDDDDDDNDDDDEEMMLVVVGDAQRAAELEARVSRMEAQSAAQMVQLEEQRSQLVERAELAEQKAQLAEQRVQLAEYRATLALHAEEMEKWMRYILDLRSWLLRVQDQAHNTELYNLWKKCKSDGSASVSADHTRFEEI